jgi:putative redox protein
MKYKFENPVHASIGTGKYQCTIEWRKGKFVSDEPIASGGNDSGPDPYTLLLSSLASCTLITLRMYADRKGWDLNEIAINVNLYQETRENKITTIIDSELIFPASVSAEQKFRLLEIAKHCPVSKILENDIRVHTC